ncbi:MAG: SpoIIE family protein phosphatase [Bacteroidales bacterium]
MQRFIAFLLLMLLISSATNSQELGQLPYKNFTHRDYLGHFQNWAVVQDSRDIMYFGNNSGVIEYDGNSWRTISINNAVARSLDTDPMGRVWVGAQDDLGYLAPDSIGEMTYYSLMHLIEEEYKPIGLVRQVFATPQGVYFSTNSSIIRINGNDVKVWHPKTFFHRTYYVEGDLYTVQPDVGLTVIKNDKLSIVSGGDFFANIRIYSLLPFNSDNLLVGTQSDGFYLLPKDTNKANRTNKTLKVKPFFTSDDEFYKQNWLYQGIQLNNGWYAFGTYRGGAAVMTPDGEIVQYIGKEQGMQDETVWHIASDNQENIWLALNNGISYTALKSQITSLDEAYGIQGVPQCVHKHNDILYLSTNAGVFYLEEDKFRRIESVLELSWNISSVKTSDDSVSLLVGTGSGVYSIENGEAKPIKNCKEPTFTVYQSRFHPDVVYLGHYQGLGVAKYLNGTWTYLGKFKEFSGRIRSFAEDDRKNLWFYETGTSIVSASISKPESLVIDKVERYTDFPFGSIAEIGASLSFINSTIRVSSSNGLAYFDPVEGEFKRDYLLGKEFAEEGMGIDIFEFDNNGNLWFESFSEEHNRRIERAVQKDDSTFVRLPTEFNQIPEMYFYDVHASNDGIIWITGTDGLFRFDPTVNKRGISIPKALIRKVYHYDSELLFGGAFDKKCPDGYYRCTGDAQHQDEIPSIPYKSNTLLFEFSSPFFGQEGRMKFSYKLEGFDEEWSDWTRNSFKEYTNLPYGDYKFLVKAQSIFEVESSVASYSFTIQRPWYHHPMMYLGYIILLVLLVVFSVSIKTKMLKASNIRLQHLVNERTEEILKQQHDIIEKNEELTQQKEEILSQRDELHQKNKHTNASIQYALTIQQATLPKKDILDNYFENFVLFKPKDVVSGDFYWFSYLPSKLGIGKRLFLAVVDCTGHGVPGAFMSMIGNRMLSEIVNERKVYDPAAILTELNVMLNKVLNQDSNENFDGMDVSLCAFDQITEGNYLVTYAGANRPLYYCKKGATEISMVKGNRKSIGGLLPDIDDNFESKLIDLSKGDALFLFTDGFTDQNNEFGKKYTTTKLNSLLMASIEKPMTEIGYNLTKSLHAHMKNTTQRDDITLVGIRLL